MSLFSADNISINFGGIKAVDGVTFDVAKGEVYTLIGPNGAGKTTIFNLISLIYPASGASAPESCWISVVLPAPLGPISAWMPPACTVRSTPSVATKPP